MQHINVKVDGLEAAFFNEQAGNASNGAIIIHHNLDIFSKESFSIECNGTAIKIQATGEWELGTLIEGLRLIINKIPRQPIGTEYTGWDQKPGHLSAIK